MQSYLGYSFLFIWIAIITMSICVIRNLVREIDEDLIIVDIGILIEFIDKIEI